MLFRHLLNSETDKFCVPSGEMPDGFEHWIIKITPDERPYLGIAEYRTYELAKICGVEMSESRLYCQRALKTSQ